MNNPAPLEYDTHPPFSVFLFVPLGLLPLFPAAIIWGLCSLATYMISGALLLRMLGWYSLRGMTLFVVANIFWEAFTRSEGAQNFTQLLTLLIIAAWVLEHQRKDGWAGWLLGLAGLLKIWPATLLASALIRRRWRLLVAGGITFVVGSVLALLVEGPGAYTAYLGPVHAIEGYWVPNGANISLVGAVARLFTGFWRPPVLPRLVSGVGLPQAVLLSEVVGGTLLAATLLFLWWCWRQRPCEAVELLTEGLLVTILLLAFPLTWWWAVLPLLLPGATTILALRQLPRPPRWWFGLLTGSLLPVLLPRDWVVAVPDALLRSQVPEIAGLGLLLYAWPTYGLLLFASLQALLLWWTVAERAFPEAGSDEQVSTEMRVKTTGEGVYCQNDEIPAPRVWKP